MGVASQRGMNTLQTQIWPLSCSSTLLTGTGSGRGTYMQQSYIVNGLQNKFFAMLARFANTQMFYLSIFYIRLKVHVEGPIPSLCC